MTVFAFKNGEVACDRQMTIDNKFAKEYSKLVDHDGKKIGMTGKASDCFKLKRWFISGAKPEDFPPSDSVKEGHIIVFDENGYQTFRDDPEPIHVGTEPAAWGCGGDIALGAMLAGKTAEEAVIIANSHNLFCGLGVDTHKFPAPAPKDE